MFNTSKIYTDRVACPTWTPDPNNFASIANPRTSQTSVVCTSQTPARKKGALVVRASKLVGKRLKTRENSTALSPPQMDKARLCKILPMLAESFQEIKASTASPENIQCFEQGGRGLDLLERFCQHRQNLAQTQHLANANRTRHVCLLVLRVSSDVCRSVVPVNKRALSRPNLHIKHVHFNRASADITDISDMWWLARATYTVQHTSSPIERNETKGISTTAQM